MEINFDFDFVDFPFTASVNLTECSFRTQIQPYVDQGDVLLNFTRMEIGEVMHVEVTTAPSIDDSSYINELLTQNLRYFVTARYEFDRQDLNVLRKMVGPVLESRFMMPSGIQLEVKA